MKAIISCGNTKIGGVPNVSLMPGTSCVPGIPCYTEGCYARKSLMYPNVVKAWGTNQKTAENNIEKFFVDIDEYLITKRPKRFRWHVAGDILSQNYFGNMAVLARFHSGTEFLCFTKRYNLNFEDKPDNLHVVLSTWPGYILPENTSLPFAWIEGDPRIPDDLYYFRCPGNCGDCDYKCWGHLDKDVHVVFPKH